MSNGENPLVGVWDVKTADGLVSCLFPVGAVLDIRPSQEDPDNKLDVFLVLGGVPYKLSTVEGDPEATGLLEFKLGIGPLVPQMIRLGVSADVSATPGNFSAFEETEVGSWTAEEGGGDVDPV